MDFSFLVGGRSRPRANSDLCRSTRGLLQRVESGGPAAPKLMEELTRNLAQMKLTLQGTTGTSSLFKS